MKTSFACPHLALISLILSSGNVFGHERPVHRKITEAAAESANVTGSAYADFLQCVSSEIIAADAKASLSDGSDYEDNFRKEASGAPDAGGMRSLNHFYDPLTALGLSNIPIDDRLRDALTGQFIPVGRDSFTWASTRDCPGIDIRLNGIGVNANTENVWSWQNARDQQLVGLTAEFRENRQAALLDMFRAVGQVVHLLEDASQPEHVRNEQHLWPHSPIEKYGGEHLDNLNYQPGMLDWRAAGFTKLNDFWDRDLYNGNDSALDEDAGGGAKLGMAEFSNGNFLGARHQYPEYFKPGSVKHYPLPSRDRSTNYEQVKANPSIGRDTYMLGDREVKGIYIKKNGDGVTGIYLSRINYLGAKKFSGLAGPAFCTIDDPNVLYDYHAKLIPKAVEYSAGILDYFFRGRLEVTLRCGTTPGMRGLEIKNISGDRLLGGTFKLLWDDSNGNRTELTGPSFTTSYTGSLDDDATTTAEFAPQASAEKYVLVYIGTIGAEGTTPHDIVDQNIAIAATTIPMPDLEFVPEWGSLSGTTGLFGSKTFSPVNAAGAAFSSDITVAVTGGPTTANIIQATVVWNGPAGVCNLHLDLDYHKTGTASIFGEVKVNGNFIFGLDTASGSYDIPFALACGQETPVTVQIDFRSVVGVSTGSADATVNGEFSIVDP